MARLLPWRRRPPSGAARKGVDPELWAIFQPRSSAVDEELLELAQQLQLQLSQQPRHPLDPEFSGRLRAELLREARTRASNPRGRRRALALPLSATVGVAGVAALTLVVASVVTQKPPAPAVRAASALAGDHSVPVTKAITISFNQPMNEAAVVAGLSIKPAVSYQAKWPNPKTLVISPVHGLAPNVGYLVTIAQPAVKAENGAQATSTVVIPFGTGSNPSTPVGRIPSVVSITDVASTAGQTSIGYLPDGGLLMLSSGTTPVVASPSPSPSPLVSPSPSLPTAGTNGTLVPSNNLGTVYVLSPTLRVVATDAFEPTPSPDSQDIAYWTPGSNGTLDLEVVPTAGGVPQRLASTAEPDPGLAWLDNGDLLYPAAGQLRQVSLAGGITPVDPGIEVDPSGSFSLSPLGNALFALPGGTPTVYSLVDASFETLPGLLGTPAWSPSGAELAYVADGSAGQTIELTTDLGAQSTSLLSASSGVALSDLSFDPSGTYLAYVSASGTLPSQLDALDVASHSSGQLGSLTSVDDPVWSPSGDQLSTLVQSADGTGQTVDSLLLSGTQLATANNQGPAATALSAASTLAGLQVANGPSALTQIASLLAPGTAIPESTLLPGKFDRFYAISSTASAAGSTSFIVDVRLVRDATNTTGPAYLPEVVAVETSGPTPEITGIASGVLTPVPTGPQVLSVVSNAASDGTTVFSIQFDSDLNPSSIGPQSISITDNGKPVSGAQFDYSALTRTVTATVSHLPSGTLTLTVSAPLADVDNTPIQTRYQVVLPPGAATTG